MDDRIAKLAAAHSRELLSYLVRYVGNRATAEDLLSDVFVKLIENFSKAHDDGFAWRPWLYKVATREAISHLRSQRLRSMILMKRPDPPEEHPLPDSAIATSQEGIKVRAAIERLSHKHRSAIIMQIYQEMSYDEIATALGINIGTVKSRINEAKAQIKVMMEVL